MSTAVDKTILTGDTEPHEVLISYTTSFHCFAKDPYIEIEESNSNFSCNLKRSHETQLQTKEKFNASVFNQLKPELICLVV